MSDQGSLNLQWSQALVAGFAAAGVSHAVLSPGSRSTPLALACLRHGDLASEVIVDERCAAFFALGIAKAARRPVLLLATSGSAPANWLPAVVEADRAGVPLILLSADRPPELHDCGANQTVPQAAMFAPYVRGTHALAAPGPETPTAWLHRLAAQVVEQATWPLAGPVHLNQPFREPLLPLAEAEAPPPAPEAAPLRINRPEPRVSADTLAVLATRLSGRPGAIICGEGDYPPAFAAAVAGLAERLACPILAEPLANLRHGPHDRRRILCHYDGWLRDALFVAGHRPEWVLRFGAFPVTRSLQGFAAGASDLTVLVDPQPRWNDPANTVTDLLRAAPLAVCEGLLEQNLAPAPADWFAAFAAAEARARKAQSALPDHCEGRLIPTLLAALPEDCPVFVGNSMVIRDLDAFAGGGDRPLRFHGNRGASGIDGNVSTALGIAAAQGRVVALLGDLACQHDLGGLAAARGRQAVFVVFNNGGGSIFEHLPQAGLPEFERGWLTPQHIDFAAAAATFGLAYALAADSRSLLAALPAAMAANGPTVIELRLERLTSVKCRQAWHDACTASSHHSDH